MALCSTWPSVATWQPRGVAPTSLASLESQATSHKAQATSHNSRATSHKSRATSHPLSHREAAPTEVARCQPGAAAAQNEWARGQRGTAATQGEGLRCQPGLRCQSGMAATQGARVRCQPGRASAQGFGARCQPGTAPTQVEGLRCQSGTTPTQWEGARRKGASGAPGAHQNLSSPWYIPGTPEGLSTTRRALGAAVGAALGAAGLFLSCPDPSWALASRELKALVASSMPYDEALENGRPTLLEFYADWCTICNDIAPMLKDVESQFRGQVNSVMINIDNPIWAEEVEEFGVEGLPHFSFLDRQGNEEALMVGRVSRSQLEENLQALAKGGVPLPHQSVFEEQSPADSRSVPKVDPRSHSQGS